MTTRFSYCEPRESLLKQRFLKIIILHRKRRYQPGPILVLLTVVISVSFRRHSALFRYINLLLTEREGRTGEYWPEVVTVRTERSEVRTKTTEGQYSPVRPEQARLVSSLLYGTLFLIVKCTSGGLHLKNVRLLHPSLKFRKKFNLFISCW